MKKYFYLCFIFCFSFCVSSIAQNDQCGTTSAEQTTTYDFVQKQRAGILKKRDTPQEVPISINIIGGSTGAFLMDSTLLLEELELANAAFAEIDLVLVACRPINYILDNNYVMAMLIILILNPDCFWIKIAPLMAVH